MDNYTKTPLWNAQLPLEERLDYLIQELTLEEKMQCLTTGCPEIRRLGIRATYMGGEAAHGIEARHDQAFNAGEPEPTTSFTQPIGMSGSFDRELIRACGQAVGEEARALFKRNGGGGLCRWAPTVDMERDPRWGRTEEAYGEDPYLTGEMASAYIQGMKGEDPFYLRCGATLKHFYANNVEEDRIRISSSVDLRNKYEYYLEPFRRAIEKGGAEAVMTSYNEINGIPAIVNDEVQKLLKDTYGLPGHVVCDGGDFQQTVYDHGYCKTHGETLAFGLKAGVDCFTDDRQVVLAAAREALDKGWITKEDINRSVRNSFRTRIRLGFFDAEGSCPYGTIGEEALNCEAHRALSRQMAAEAIVLLKNEGGALPIPRENVTSFAVIGPLADVWYKDWYCGIPPYHVTPLAGIRRQYEGIPVVHESGENEIYLTCRGRYVGLDSDSRLYLTDREQAEVFRFTDWGFGSATLQAKSNGRFVTMREHSYQLGADKKEAFSWFIREAFAFCQQGEENSFQINSWNGRPLAVDEAGYLTVIKTEEKKKGEDGDEASGIVSCALSEGEPALFGMEILKDGIAEAVKLAAAADRAILILGSNPVINSKEEVDRSTLALPPAQQLLADAVLARQPDTVVVLITNYPYAIGKLQEEAPAILYTPSGSQELGTALGQVLGGEQSPAGRLPMTWYRSEKDLPDMQDYDIIQGKRTYRYFEGKALYPFGYGLSYAAFSYGPLSVREEQQEIAVTLTVTNQGTCQADEVVQLYVHQETSRVKQPRRRLVGFERVKGLTPGETVEVTFRVQEEDLNYYDVITGRLIREEGIYTFLAGASSEDIRQEKTLFLTGEKAPVRDPFTACRAACYDAYENCFLYRGSRGHTCSENTCVIPGKAGDTPDSVRLCGESGVSGLLQYRDFLFTRKPGALRLRYLAEGKGEILLCCLLDGTEAVSEWKIPVMGEEASDFIWQEYPVEESFGSELPLNENCTLEIRLTGRIRLAEFRFLR